MLKLHQVECYWEACTELVSTLKEGAAVSLIPMEKREGSLEKKEGDSSLEDTKGKVLAELAPIQPFITLSQMVQAMQAMLATVREPPLFDSLHLFIAHLEVEYRGSQHDQMQHIQDFQCDKEDTLHTIYTKLAWFVVESGGVFVESQLVKIFLSKIDKRLLNFVTPKIIINYKDLATLAQVLVEVERCDKALC